MLSAFAVCGEESKVDTRTWTRKNHCLCDSARLKAVGLGSSIQEAQSNLIC
jgi:hypothetical protein